MDTDTPWEKNSSGECAEVTTSLTVLDGNGIQPSDAFSVVQDGILPRSGCIPASHRVWNFYFTITKRKLKKNLEEEC